MTNASVDGSRSSVSRFGVPLGSVQHRMLVLGLLLVATFALALFGRAALPVATGALVLSIGAHLGVVGTVVLAATGGLGFITRSARVADVERMLDEASLNGTETVLDVGCGDGLVAIRAARRLSSGKVIAIDDWHREHGTRLISPDIVKANAAAEGVAERVEVRTAAFTALDVPDASADVVLACFSLHHLPKAQRNLATRELVRVVRHGGRVLIAEPRYRDEFARTLSDAGMTTVQHRARTFPRALFGWVVASR